MHTRHTGLRGVLLAVAVVVVVGCSDGPRMGTVSGTVTIDGRAAERGAITFFPVDGKAMTTGGEIKEGKYTARVPVGASKVEIRVPKVVGKKKLYDTPDSPVQDLLEEVLPARFNNATELRLEVKSGTNEKNWELTSK